MANDPAKQLVAIVDDDESLGRALMRSLQTVGLKAETFSSPEEFLNTGRVHEWACLILDIVMPGKTGLDLRRELLAEDRHVPVIFISAEDDERIRKQAHDLGAIAFLVKPFQDQALFAALRLALGDAFQEK